jgi:peptide/nickel transport system substrate-binding protein
MRKLAFLNILVLLSLLVASCASSTATQAPVEPAATEAPAEPAATEAPAEPAATEAPAEPMSKYNEAPMLAEKVAAGTLPSVDERLPENPKVYKPLVETGKYGGQLRFGFTGSGAGAATWGGMLYVSAWEHLISWKPDFSGVEANVLESYDVSADATEYTFHMRKGMKWSDGEPFTADDILFYLEDVISNKDLFPGGIGADWIPSGYGPGLKFEKIDDYTLKLSFDKPYGTLPYNLAAWGGRQFVMYPKHYLQQFHAKYNPDVDKLVAEDGAVKDWIGLFFKKSADTWGDPSRYYDDPNLPTIYAWVLKEPIGTGTTLLMERNPYYFKVDDQGNQLPYIDTILGTSYQDESSRTFAMLNGDLDYLKEPGEPNRELYYDAVDEGKPIRIVNPINDYGNMQSVHFNFTALDPVKREVFQNKDFRIGMSYAVDRSEIIEVVFKGQGEPAQVCPYPSSPLYNEQLCTQYVEFDLDKANEYLDKVLPDKDAEGFRLDKNGARFNPIFTVMTDMGEGPHWVQVAEILIKHWAKVGVEVQLNAVTNAVWDEQRAKNNFDIWMFHGGEGGSGITAIIDPRWHLPGEWGAFFSNAWYFGLVDPNNEFGEPMPEELLAIREIYKTAIQQPTYEGQVEWMKKLMQSSADNFWTIGTNRPGPLYQPASVRLGNVPDQWLNGWVEGFIKIIAPEQWFIKE